MTNLYHFTPRQTAGRPSVFTRGELASILQLYEKNVARGRWRDYAIDSLPGLAAFSIFRSSKEAPIFIIAKIGDSRHKKTARFALYSGEKTLKESSALTEVLRVCDAQER